MDRTDKREYEGIEDLEREYAFPIEEEKNREDEDDTTTAPTIVLLCVLQENKRDLNDVVTMTVNLGRV